MPKTFPVRLEIEEIALGTVLRKLHEMPGVVKFDIDFGHGGQGPGRTKLEAAAATKPQDVVLEALKSGPLSIKDINGLIGGNKARAYGVMDKLKKSGLTKSMGHGQHALVTHAVKGEQVKRGPAGRAAPGSGPALLRATLSSLESPMQRGELASVLRGHGMSAKSISGVLDRAKRDGIIKKVGDGYSLTARAMNGAANG